MQNASEKFIEDAYLKPIDDVLKTVFVDPDEGLSDKEIRKKIQENGKNILEEQSKRSIWNIVLVQVTQNLIFVTMGLGVAFFVFGGISAEEIFALIQTSFAWAIAAIPEGLSCKGINNKN